MADVTQAALTLNAHAALTHPGSSVGSATSIVGDIGIHVYVYHANVETTANAEGVRYKIQGNPEASNNERWQTLDEIVTGTAAAATEAMTASEPAGETVLAVASTTDFAANDEIYIQDAGTLADSEWAQIDRIVTNTSIDILDGLTNAKDSSDVIWDAERRNTFVLLAGVSRVRGVVLHRAATGANIHYEVQALRWTDFE